jgi:hypothetical protein
MMDFKKSLDGKPRATVIQRFDGTILLLGPKGKKIEFEDGVTLHQIPAEVEKLGWVIAVEHLHPSFSEIFLPSQPSAQILVSTV